MAYRKTMTPPEFMLMFTAGEAAFIRYKMKDKVTMSFMETLNDPRLSQIDLEHPTVAEALNVMMLTGAITQERLDEIALGIPMPDYKTSMPPARFKLLLGQAARLAIRAAVGYTGSAAAEKTKAAILGDWWEILNDKTLEAVSVEDPDTIAALGYLVSIGILTEAKRDDILLGVPV